MSTRQKVLIGLLSATACVLVGGVIVVLFLALSGGGTLGGLPETPTAVPIIVDAPSIIGLTSDEVQSRYGAYSDAGTLKPGTDQNFPDGGKWLVFSGMGQGEEMQISFRNDGKAASVDYDHLQGRHFVLDDWRLILRQFNLDVNQMPDKAFQSGLTGRPWKYIWSNYHGYMITLNDEVGSEYVLVFELFKP